MDFKPRLSEVGLCCIDLYESDRWFREVLGLWTRGGCRRPIALPAADGTVTTTEAMCWWLDAGRGSPVLALYQFSDPLSRLLPPDHHPGAPGIARMAFHVPAFDTVIARLEAAGTPPIAGIVGEQGRRCAMVRNPDGVFIEVLEQDPLPTARAPKEVGTALRRLTICTRDLAASTMTIAALTATATDRAGNVDARHSLFAATPACTIELVPAEWAPDTLSATPILPDQGICRLEFSAPSVASVVGGGNAVYDPLEPPERGPAAAVRDTASGVLLALVEGPVTPVFADERPTPAQHWVRSKVSIDAPSDQVWSALNDHDRMLEWLAADELEVTAPGSPDPAGYGAVRVLSTFGRRVVQQVTRIAPDFIGYRAIGGTPFRYHNGTVALYRSNHKTRVDWTIRFETHEVSAGKQLLPALQAGIDEQMAKLKAMIEGDRATR